MNNKTANNPCPCLSGLQFSNCCAAKDRIEPDVFASISAATSAENDNLTPELQAALDKTHTNPDLFPARINFFKDKVRLVKMSPRWYRESVFLDPVRILGRCVIESDLQWLQEVSEKIHWQPLSIIFHSAFCGSTLMSKALHSVFNCLPLREPEALSNLQVYLNSQKATPQQKALWLDSVMRILSRRYDEQQAVVVKANDNANPMMMKLLEWQHEIPILFMYTPLNEFVAGCLKADNRREWIRNRYKLISNIAGRVLHIPSELSIDDESYGEMAAVYWSYNIALYQEAWRQFPHRLRSLDFNVMLARPLESIEACGQFFGLEALPNIDPNEAISGHFGIYSKNSAFTYSPQQRNNDIEKLLSVHHADMALAEILARELLHTDYPEDHLPGKLID